MVISLISSIPKRMASVDVLETYEEAWGIQAHPLLAEKVNSGEKKKHTDIISHSTSQKRLYVPVHRLTLSLTPFADDVVQHGEKGTRRNTERS